MEKEPQIEAATETQSPREWLIRLVLAGVGILIALVVAEVGVRIVGFRPQRVDVQVTSPALVATSHSDPQQREASGLPDNVIYRHTPVGKRMRPSLQVQIRNHAVSGKDVLVRTNSLGFRNPELQEKKHRRILFLGDSITLADYVDAEDTFVRQVETLGRAAGHELETVNAGIGSTGLENQLALLVENVDAVKPDIVFLCFYLNDVEESPGVIVNPPPQALAWSWLAWHLVGASSSLRSISALEASTDLRMNDWKDTFAASHRLGEGDPLADEAAFNALIVSHFRDWGNAWSKETWGQLEPLFRTFCELGEEHSFEVMTLIFPVRHQVESQFENRWPQDQFLPMMAKLKVPALDVLPKLREEFSRGNEALYYDHCHFTEYGNELVATWILERIAIVP